MKRKYAGPLGRLARLLLWTYGEIDLPRDEVQKLIAMTMVTTTLAKEMMIARWGVVVVEAKKGGQDGVTKDERQAEIPWAPPFQAGTEE